MKERLAESPVSSELNRYRYLHHSSNKTSSSCEVPRQWQSGTFWTFHSVAWTLNGLEKVFCLKAFFGRVCSIQLVVLNCLWSKIEDTEYKKSKMAGCFFMFAYLVFSTVSFTFCQNLLVKSRYLIFKLLDLSVNVYGGNCAALSQRKQDSPAPKCL